MPLLPFPLAGSLGGLFQPPSESKFEAMVNRLAEQFKRQPNLLVFLQAVANQLEDLEASKTSLSQLNVIDANSGVNLDVIGKKIGEPRQGFDDGSYRLHLKARTCLNTGSGTVEDILKVFNVLLGSGATLRTEEQFPAALTLHIDNLPVDSTIAPYLVKFLQLAKDGGVRAILHWSENTPSNTFGFATWGGAGFNAGIFSSAEG